MSFDPPNPPCETELPLPPKELVEAAYKLDYWFRAQGRDDWAVGPVCSRRMFDRLTTSTGNSQSSGVESVSSPQYPAASYASVEVKP